MRNHELLSPHHLRSPEHAKNTQDAEDMHRLREAEERIDLIVRGCEAGIWCLDLTTGKLSLSQQFRTLLGWSDEIVPDSGAKLLELMHPKDVSLVQSAVKAGIAGKDGQDGFEVEFRLRGSFGQYHWFHGKAAIQRHPEGRALRAAGSMTEITARVRAEAELRRHHDRLEKKVTAQIQDIKNSETRLTSAINAISDGFLLFDANQAVVMINERMKTLHPELAGVIRPGASVTEVISTLLRFSKSETEYESWMGCFERLLKGISEDEIQRADGTWLKINRAKTPSGDTIVLHSDITRYKQQEARLVAQAAALEQALAKEREVNNLHRQFVFMASHEFRTPLAIIDGSAQLLCADTSQPTSERIAKRVVKIRNAVSRMTSLIDSTLTAARLDAGKIEINLEPCNLRALVSDVCESQQEIDRARASSHL